MGRKMKTTKYLVTEKETDQGVFKIWETHAPVLNRHSLSIKMIKITEGSPLKRVSDGIQGSQDTIQLNLEKIGMILERVAELRTFYVSSETQGNFAVTKGKRVVVRLSPAKIGVILECLDELRAFYQEFKLDPLREVTDEELEAYDDRMTALWKAQCAYQAEVENKTE